MQGERYDYDYSLFWTQLPYNSPIKYNKNVIADNIGEWGVHGDLTSRLQTHLPYSKRKMGRVTSEISCTRNPPSLTPRVVRVMQTPIHPC